MKSPKNIKEALEYFALCLKFIRCEGTTEIFISKDAYSDLQHLLSAIQRMPTNNQGMDFGIEIHGNLKIKPIVELKQMKEEIKRLQKRLYGPMIKMHKD